MSVVTMVPRRLAAAAARLRPWGGEHGGGVTTGDTWPWVAACLVAWLLLGGAGLVAMLAAWALHIAVDPAPRLVATLGIGTLVVAALAWLAGGLAVLDEVYTISQRWVASRFAVAGVVLLAVAAWRAGPRERLARDLGAGAADLRRLGRRLTRPTAPVGRAPEVALLRAVAIVVVVAIHVIPAEFATGRTDLDRWLGDVSRFAVPAFFLATGHLAARRPPGDGWIPRRLRRLLPPYLVAAAVAIALGWTSSAFPVVARPLRAVLLGAAFGPHYFVFVLLLLTPLVPWLVRLRGRWLLLAVAATAIVEAALATTDASLFWQLRNPLSWLAFLVAGIATWEYRHRLARWQRAWPGVALAWAVVAVALVVVADDTTARELLTSAGIWLALGTCWLAGLERRTLPRVAWWLDEATYALYLHHLPFAIALTSAIGAPSLSVSAPAALGSSLIGACSVVVVARHLLGARSRLVVGA